MLVNKYINNGIRGVTPRIVPNIVVATLLATGVWARTLIVFSIPKVPACCNFYLSIMYLLYCIIIILINMIKKE